MRYESWGRFPKISQSCVNKLFWSHDAISVVSEISGHFLPRGLGRSYGDSCLAKPEDTLLDVTQSNRIISFDRDRGVLCVEAGISFSEILSVVLKAGWFLPVTPGTKYITVAGALANDIHGKNHVSAGNFGNHVLSFCLLRSDGRVVICSYDDDPHSESGKLFSATVGGMGLTGVILWVKFKLKPIKSPLIDQEVIRFRGIEEFIALSKDSEKDFEYSVSWVDCLTHGDQLRGLFIRGNHSSEPFIEWDNKKRKLSIPFDFPNWALNTLSVRAFNSLYYGKSIKKVSKSLLHFDPFFYPLDSILNWNRIYGQQGFLQYQFVVPYEADGGRVINQIMKKIASSGQGSFLSVLKVFGSIPGRGLMSFPREGVTLALDFKNTGSQLYHLLDHLDELVIGAGGAIYPAKDARMSVNTFKASFPRIETFKELIDPRIASAFSKRVGLT